MFFTKSAVAPILVFAGICVGMAPSAQAQVIGKAYVWGVTTKAGAGEKFTPSRGSSVETSVFQVRKESERPQWGLRSGKNEDQTIVKNADNQAMFFLTGLDNDTRALLKRSKTKLGGPVNRNGKPCDGPLVVGDVCDIYKQPSGGGTLFTFGPCRRGNQEVATFTFTVK